MASAKYRAKLERRAVAQGLDAKAVKGASDAELQKSIKAVKSDKKLFKKLHLSRGAKDPFKSKSIDPFRNT